MKTGVQEIVKALKTLDSGFRQNEVKKDQFDFFTPSVCKGTRLCGGVPFPTFSAEPLPASTTFLCEGE